MATMRLIPSTYYQNNTNYTSVTNPNNMYANTDSTTYAQLNNTRSSTNNTYYVYIRGFNFGSIPSDAIVSGFSVKIKASETNLSTSSSYRMSLYNGTTSISSTTVTSSLSTTANIFTFPIPSTLTWATLTGYGANFGIRVPLRRASTSSSSYAYVYGAEIEVTYTVPVPVTITSTLSGDGVIDPSGAYSCYEGDPYTLTITPTDSSASVTATKNGVDITSSLVSHSSGSAERYPDSYQTGGSINGTGYQQTIGKSVANPSTQTGNDYFSTVQGGSGSTWIDYYFDFDDIPTTATITSVSVQVRGHCEDASQSREIANIQLYSGTTAKGDDADFTSTSNTTLTLNPGTWTAAELHDAKLRFTIGVYGGLIVGVTWIVTYTAPTYYVYSYETDGDATIAVTIGGSTKKIFIKTNGSWVPYTKAYKKVNGSWVLQSDLSTVFNASTNYVRGN